MANKCFFRSQLFRIYSASLKFMKMDFFLVIIFVIFILKAIKGYSILTFSELSCPSVDYPQFPSAIFSSSFHTQFLSNVMTYFKSTKESKSKPALQRSLSYIQKKISFFQFLLHSEENFVFKVSLFDYHGDLNLKRMYCER